MRTKQLAAFILIVCSLAGAMVTGCNKSGKESDAAGPVSVVFYLWDDPAYEPIIEAYNASQEDVHVDARFIPTNEYEAKISTLLAGGAEIDGYMQKRSTDIFAHYYNGYLEPLDELCTETGFDLDAIAGYRDAITIDGKTLAIPFRGASYFTYYNKKVFEAAGLPTPDTYVESGEWTWERFISVAQSISDKLPDTYGGFLYTWGSSNVMPALQDGMSFLDAEGKLDINETLLDCYRYRRELEESGAIMPLIETKVTKTHYSKAFYSGKVGMLIIGEWFPGFMLSGRDENQLEGYTWDDWSLTRMPCNEADYRTFGNPTFSHIHAGSKKKAAMFQFLAWMGGPEGAEIVAGNGLLPAYITPEVKERFRSILPDEGALKYFTEPRTVNTQFYNKYGSRVESELVSVMEEFLTGELQESALRGVIEERLKQVAQQIQ